MDSDHDRENKIRRKTSMKKKYLAVGAAGLAMAIGVGAHHHVTASDHDDGTQSTAQNNLNLTDLYAFREDNQTGNSADAGNLILIMDSNGHTPAGQQVFFNTRGLYDFHITRVAASDIDTTPTGKEDTILRFQFGEPDQNQHQPITVTIIKDGQPTAGAAGNTGPLITTSLSEGMATKVTENTVSVGSSDITVFAGMREDPFFFDVEQFLKVRAGAAGLGPSASFRDRDKAVDGFANQNVNSIVARLPIAMLQSGAGEPVFDVWETTTLQ
jgi:hypothetical protein